MAVRLADGGVGIAVGDGDGMEPKIEMRNNGAERDL